MYHAMTSLVSYSSDDVETEIIRKPRNITEKTTSDTKARTPCEILPPTHTLPDLSEVMMDHNLMEILSKTLLYTL